MSCHQGNNTQNSGDYEGAFLREWRRQKGHGATLRALITAANEADKKKLADDILKHFSSGTYSLVQYGLAEIPIGDVDL